MSLKKLWNSICGRAPQPEVTAPPTGPVEKTLGPEKTERPVQPELAQRAPVAATSPNAARPPLPARKAAPATASAVPASPSPASATASGPEIVAPRRGVLSMLSRGQHDALLRMIGEAKPTSILEIGIGDGSRTPAILSMLDESGCQPHAIKMMVIDQFELAGGEVAMRDYHRQLAGLNLRPVIFPEPVGRGLINVAHRFGTVDLILIDAKTIADHAHELATFLGKVTHGGTVVLSNESGKWTVRQPGPSQARRAA